MQAEERSAKPSPCESCTPRGPEDFLVFGAPLIEEEDIEEVLDSLRSGWIGTGPKVARLEEAFRDYKEVPHSVAVNSCTAALHLSMVASGIGPGAEVITTALTFCATVNAIIHAGARPVIVDVDPFTMNIDARQVEERITSRTQAILPVHFAGRPCDMDPLLEIAARHNLVVVEDCAHAIETEYKGRKAGTMGDFGCFSFYVTKNVVTGEGGMVLTKSEGDAARIKSLALHGMTKDAWHRFKDAGYRHYEVVEAGFKFNMMDIQASMGVHQLGRVERNWARRKQIWDFYDREFRGLPLRSPQLPDPRTRHAYHLYTILVGEDRSGAVRDAFLDEMTRHNIGVGVHYLSLPEHSFYQREFGWLPEHYPNAMRIGRQTVSLPLSPKLTDRDVEDVVAAVRCCLARVLDNHR